MVQKYGTKYPLRDIPFEREKIRYENGNVFRRLVKRWVVVGTEDRRADNKGLDFKD